MNFHVGRCLEVRRNGIGYCKFDQEDGVYLEVLR